MSFFPTTNFTVDTSYLVIIIKILLIIVPLLIAVAYFTLAERKILGAIQRRMGPNVVGVFGLLQPLSDGFKLLMKETVLPSSANQLIFIISPILTFTISLMGWAIIPFDKYSLLAEMNIGVLYLFAMSSLGVYGIIMSGWSSNSKYAFLGALRSTAQMVSYEVSIGFIMITIVVCVGSFNLEEIIDCQRELWFVFTFFPLFLMFFTCGLAETNRHPFDLPEAEAELVAGYQTEYSGMMYALFWLGEYANILLLCGLGSVLFLGGWLSPIDAYPFNAIPAPLWLIFKILFLFILFALVKAIVPRYRYDQLMRLGWKVFLPFSLFWVVLTAAFLYFFNLLPK